MKRRNFSVLILSAVFSAMPLSGVLAQSADDPGVMQISAPDAGTARATSTEPASAVPSAGSAVSQPVMPTVTPSVTGISVAASYPSAPPSAGPSNIPFISVAVAGIAALGFGLYKMMRGQASLPRRQAKGEAQNSDQNKNNKCNLIKATMDAKFKELTDLEGRVKGKIKGTIKGVLEDALLTEGEKTILKKIESAKGEYEKLKALYEECIVDAETGKTKILKFRGFKAEMILKGEKTSSLRLFDDKDLKAGDELELVNWDTKKTFGKAKITEIIEKKLGEVEEKDLIGHEPLEGGPVENLKKYYGEKVGPETTGKIVRFKLEK
ncbi:hypothetical protein A2662_00985 [Candidatus Giovannonibacteria bacterium RIFCSPHIGHO2_01_FULL_45_33]|nr:MAG: hypothetical protein A2662_00985 [Candidatus Giovannonibacteria bacterium RIFCSPHIGHO2_01_FULL_45_33]